MALSRREIIQFGLKGILLSQSPNLFSLDDDFFDCIILGAGISGLTAAQYLKRYAYPRPLKILVLEGNSRIGGRIETIQASNGFPIELGAEFIHRAPGTVHLWHDVQQFQLKTATLPKMQQSYIFHPELTGPSKPMMAAMQWDLIEPALMYHKINSYRGRDMRACEWAAKNHSNLIKDIFNLIPLQQPAQLGEDFLTMALTGHMPGSKYDLSVLGFQADHISEQLKEKNEYKIIHGYQTLIDKMARGLHVKTNHSVEKISYRPEGVEIFCQNGKTFRARTTLVTFSVGMLKSNLVQFDPILPEEKLLALDHLQAGYHSKYILEFDQPFWSKNLFMAHHPWRKRAAGMTYFNLSYGQPHAPFALTALTMGDDAKKLDRLSDEELVKRITYDLDQMFPQAAPTLNRVRMNSLGKLSLLRKQWKDDPFALGGNSYIAYQPRSPISVHQVRNTLAKTDAKTPNLFWAGEACALDTQPASVHGAHASAIQAAYKVFQKLR